MLNTSASEYEPPVKLGGLENLEKVYFFGAKLFLKF